ncbi:TetR/AcrR family transcriptional regulator [Mycobacteroides chelonae]|uniref:TetR/AcrR family transcriptional regulator n=1 Tax=Mycobacteroides chelonae TaxID=1774 RepID=UPI001FB16896|nr:TetR/AcrR family transcriptional regulator [Mycobacteroides chelonae]
MSSPAGRSYSGLPADERLARRRQQLLEAGLDILGAPEGPGDLTLRAVCQRSGLAQRYFYESFADKDEFAVAIFDWAVEGLASTVEAEVAAVTALIESPQWCSLKIPTCEQLSL